MDWPWLAVAVSQSVIPACYITSATIVGIVLAISIFGCSKKKISIEKDKPKETGSLSLKVTKNAVNGDPNKPTDDAAKATGTGGTGFTKTSDDKLNTKGTTESRESKVSKEHCKTVPSQPSTPQPNRTRGNVAVGAKAVPIGQKAETEYDKLIPMPDNHEPSSAGAAADPERTMDNNVGSVDVGGATTHDKTKNSVHSEVKPGCMANGKFEKTQTEASQTQSKSKHSDGEKI